MIVAIWQDTTEIASVNISTPTIQTAMRSRL
jgi:hypothetical protein